MYPNKSINDSGEESLGLINKALEIFRNFLIEVKNDIELSITDTGK